MKTLSLATIALAVSLTAIVPALAANDTSATCRTLGQQVNEALAGASGDAAIPSRDVAMDSSIL